MMNPRKLLARCALVQRPTPKKAIGPDNANSLPKPLAHAPAPSARHALYRELMRRHDRVRACTNE